MRVYLWKARWKCEVHFGNGPRAPKNCAAPFASAGIRLCVVREAETGGRGPATLISAGHLFGVVLSEIVRVNEGGARLHWWECGSKPRTACKAG